MAPVTTQQLLWAVGLLSMDLDRLRGALEQQCAANPLLRLEAPFPPVDAPEVLVEVRDGALVVSPNPAALPVLSVGDGDEALVRDASWVVRAVAQRARTFAAVVGVVSAHAPDWFSDASAPRCTLDRDAVAEAAALHRSALDRVLSGDKHLRCPRGLLRFDALLPA